MGGILLIDTILKYHLRKEIAKENSSKPSPSRKESAKENTSKPYKKKVVFRTRQTELVKQIVTPTKHIQMKKKVHVMKQGSLKKNMLECVIVGEKGSLSIQTKNQMKTVVMRRRINYLNVVGKVMLKIKMRKEKNIIEEEEIGIRKCRRKSRIDK